MKGKGDAKVKEWFLYRASEQSGPYIEEEFFKMGKEGNIGAEDLVWNSQLLDWTRAAEIPGLLTAGAESVTNQDSSSMPGKEEILNELLSYSDHGPFRVTRGDDTDLIVSNEVAESSWYSGKKKVVYSAQLLLKEAERTAYYWEMLKESSSGISFQMGMQKKKIKGIELFQKNREKGYAPDGKLVYDYQFDYGSLRELFKNIVESYGWQFKVVILKSKSTY